MLRVLPGALASLLLAGLLLAHAAELPTGGGLFPEDTKNEEVCGRLDDGLAKRSLSSSLVAPPTELQPTFACTSLLACV